MSKLINVFNGTGSKRYYRGQEIADKIYHGNLVRTGKEICRLRKLGWLIITAEQGYTLRPKKKDYEYHAKVMFKHSFGTLNNQKNIIKRGKEISEKQIMQICQEQGEQIMKVLNFIKTAENRLLAHQESDRVEAI